jgi:hypothetical protein
VIGRAELFNPLTYCFAERWAVGADQPYSEGKLKTLSPRQALITRAYLV